MIKSLIYKLLGWIPNESLYDINQPVKLKTTYPGTDSYYEFGEWYNSLHKQIRE